MPGLVDHARTGVPQGGVARYPGWCSTGTQGGVARYPRSMVLALGAWSWPWIHVPGPVSLYLALVHLALVHLALDLLALVHLALDLLALVHRSWYTGPGTPVLRYLRSEIPEI